MSHGGHRPNAGRKKGSTTKRRAAINVQAVAEGITPAEVMQRIMERYYSEGDYDRAAAVAKDLAPYRHPRLGSLTVKGDSDAPIRIQFIEVGRLAPPVDPGDNQT